MLVRIIQVNVRREREFVGMLFFSKQVRRFIKIRAVETAWTNQDAKIQTHFSVTLYAYFLSCLLL
jgi:hypothetical protein